MTENQSSPPEENPGSASDKTKYHSQGLLQALKELAKSRLSIKDLAEPEKTIEGITKDIEFSGFPVWILVFSIIIASIGLNVNSTAVVIGAMLISPLMGPIMGLGLGIGINDWPLLKKSLKNMGVMVFMSIATSSIYFFFTPLTNASLELIARTTPTLLDVFVAFFGGIAGILAGSRREKSNVIPGVAIATALMPPLCTAGYGIATLQLNFFFGAFYLFLINTFFIALSTLLVVRYLRFPIKSLVDEEVENKRKRYVILTSLVITIPSIILFYTVVNKTIFEQKANAFIDEVIDYKGTEMVKRDILSEDTLNVIEVVMLGEEIPIEVIHEWQRQIPKYNLENTVLQVIQGSSGNGELDARVGDLVSMVTLGQKDIQTKNDEIISLSKKLEKYRETTIPPSLMGELKVQYPELQSAAAGNLVSSDFNKVDTLFVARLNWNTLPDSTKKIQIREWLKLRLKKEDILLQHEQATIQNEKASEN